jgi:hypothetical protein
MRWNLSINDNLYVKMGRYLRLCHYSLAGSTMIATIFADRQSIKYILVFWIGMIISNLYYGGCMITRIERYLTGENLTIVDPLLINLGLTICKKNRQRITVISGVLMLMVSILRLI